jgi:lambda repressor-like predicted transcriptional regulator
MTRTIEPLFDREAAERTERAEHRKWLKETKPQRDADTARATRDGNATSIRAQARKHDLNPHTVQSRIRRGWPLERALSDPISWGGSPWSPARYAARRRKIRAMRQPE